MNDLLKRVGSAIKRPMSLNTNASEQSQVTMKSAEDTLTDFVPFMDTYRSDYYLVPSQRITGEQILKAILLIVPLAEDIVNFQVKWSPAAEQGPDALKRHIDIDLAEKGKLDMVQVKILIRRMSKLDELIPAFQRVKTYIDDLKSKYDANPQGNYSPAFNRVHISLNTALDSLEEERENLRR